VSAYYLLWLVGSFKPENQTCPRLDVRLSVGFGFQVFDALKC